MPGPLTAAALGGGPEPEQPQTAVANPFLAAAMETGQRPGAELASAIEEAKRTKRTAAAIRGLKPQVIRALRQDPVSGRSLASDYPDVARMVREAVTQFPELGIDPARVPGVEPPSTFEKLANVAVGAGAGAWAGAKVGGVAGGAIGLAGGPAAEVTVPAGGAIGAVIGGIGGGIGGGILAHKSLEAAAKAGERPGTRLTPLDITTGVLGTGGRLTAAVFGDVAKLKGETKGEAALQAWKLPQAASLGGEPPRDWTWAAMENARRAGHDPYAIGVIGKGALQDIAFDPLMWLLMPARIPEAAKAIDQIGLIALRALREAGEANAAERAVGIQRLAARVFDNVAQAGGGFWDAVPKLKDVLGDLTGSAGARAIELFDKEGFALGRRGAGARFLPAAVAESAAGLVGGLTRVAGLSASFPFRAAAYGLEKAGATGAAKAARAAAIPGIVVDDAGRMFQRVRDLLVPVAQPLEIVPMRFLTPASKPARAAGEILRSKPWGNLMAEIVGAVEPSREVAPAGFKAGLWPGQTEFDAYAAMKAYYARRAGLPDIIAHTSEASATEIGAVAPKTSSIPHRQRAGRTLLHFVRGRWNQAMRTHIDASTGEIYETALGKTQIPDARGFVQAALEWAGTRARELMDAGTLIEPNAARNQTAALERRAAIEARIADLEAALESKQATTAAWAADARIALAKAKATYADLQKREGDLTAEAAALQRKTAHALDDMKLIGEHGLDPKRHRVRLPGGGIDDSIVSIATPAGPKGAMVASKFIPATWEAIEEIPKGLPRKGRLYYRQTTGQVALPGETYDAAVRAQSAGADELGKIRTRLDVLAGKIPGRTQAVNAAEDAAVADAAASLDRIDKLRASALVDPKSITERARKIQHDLSLAVRRAYSGSLEEARGNPAMAPEVEWDRRLANVERHFGVDLTETWKNGAVEIGNDVDDLAEIHMALDGEVKALFDFASHRYDAVLKSIKAEFGEAAVQEYEGYTRHVIQERDRILKSFPTKTYVSAERPGAHREILTVRELKENGYDPVEDVLTSLFAAETSAAQMIFKKRWKDAVLGDRRWAIPLNEGKGLTGATHDVFTDLDTGKQFRVPKEIYADLVKLYEMRDPGKLEAIAKVFDRVLINPWKGWATYTRWSFHLRNAYSNLWLMWMGGFDMVARPERLSEAIQVGSLGRLAREEATATARAARGPAGKVRTLLDQAEDRWTAKLKEWAAQKYLARDGKTYTGQELWNLASEHGVVNKRWQAADVERNFNDTLRVTRKWDATTGAWKMLPLSPNSHVLKFGGAVGQHVENHARLSLFMDRILFHGDTPLDAAWAVKRHLFDYKDLTPFEAKVLRRLVPFYTWARKATERTVFDLLEHPERFSALGKAKRAVETQAKEHYYADAEYRRATDTAGDYFRREWGWWTWYRTPQGSPVFFDPEQPFVELQRFQVFSDIPQEGVGAAAKRALLGVLEQMHPIYKLPMALAVGEKFPERRPLLREREARRYTAAILKALGVRPKTIYDPAVDKYLSVFDERAIYVLENALPHLAVASKLFDDEKNDPVLEERRPLRAFREATGLGAIPVNRLEAARALAQELAGGLKEYTPSTYRYLRRGPPAGQGGQSR